MRALLFLAVALPLCAQAPPAVTGTVSNAMTHAPISGAAVKLTGPASYEARTDATGAFHIDGVQPGQYTAEFNASGFLSLPNTHAARRPFAIPAGGDPVNLVVALPPTARMQGTVRNGDGRPAARAEVRLLHSHGGGGTFVTADDEGRFTIPELVPGRYLIQVIPGRQSKENVWAPVWFPDSDQRAGAQPIVVPIGAELSGYDIRLRATPRFRIRGSVVDDDGKPAAAVSLKLTTTDPWDKPEAEVKSGEDGAFEFTSVRPCDWRLLAELKRDGVTLRGVEPVLVSRQDIDHLEVRLSRPFVLHGFVDREERRDAKGERKVSMIALEPVDGRQDGRPGGFHKQDGSLVIENVYPGRYEIKPFGFLPGYYVESVKLGEREVIGQYVDLVDGSQPIRVTYRSNAPRVKGTVEGGCDVAVLLPQDEAFLDGQFIRTGACDAEGRFEIGSVRPGSYYAFAFDRVDMGAFEDASFVRGIAARAEKVHVERGEAATVQLKQMAWPE
jgi:hypothetical protein